MQMITRAIPRRPGTYMQPGDDGLQVNRVTLRAEPWAVQPVEAERPRPVDVPQYRVTSPKIDVLPHKPVTGDRFAEWDEDILREEWAASILPQHRPGFREAVAGVKPCSAASYSAVKAILAAAPTTRAAIATVTGLSERTLDTVFRDLRAQGLLAMQRQASGRYLFSLVTK